MINDSFIQLSLGELKDVLLNDLTLYVVAITYVLVYVVYKTLGRYIYFKPQEHSSKVNRTFLVLALLVIAVDFFSKVTIHLPFLEEYRWLYTISSLILVFALLSIAIDRMIWRYDANGYKYERYRDYLPIEKEYYKTARSVNTGDGMRLSSREEEGIRSTKKNIHSDALLNILALVVFIAVAGKWAYESSHIYGKNSLIFFVTISFWMSIVFVDCCIISWIEYLETKYYRLFKKDKPKSNH